MRVWRICRKRYAADPLNGRGGVVAGGRWHPKGTRIVYTSATLSLATLEVLVNADRDLIPRDLVRIEIHVPDDLAIERLGQRALPSEWRTWPAPPELQRIGAKWISRAATAVLRVPSAVIPEESNYLVNPVHRDSAKLKVVGKRPFELDARLLE